MSDFRRSWYRRKACAAYFCKVPDFAGIRAWACEIWSREQRPPGVFLVRLRDSFPIGIPARPGKFLAIREFHVVHECVFFPTCPGLRINLLRVRKTLRASVATSVGKVPEFSATALFRRPVFTRVVDVAPDVGFRRSWYRRKAYATYFSKGFLGMVDPSRVGNGSVKPRSNLGQPWSTLVKLGQTSGNVSRTFFLGLFDVASASSDQAGLVRAVLVLRADTRENPVVRLGLRASPSGVQMGIPGLGEDRTGCKKTVRGLKWHRGACLGTRATLIDDQSSPTRPIGGSTVWNLSPNRLRSDLTWGLPKLQIGWFNGLESQSKQVEGCKSGGSTVWNLSPNRLRGDLTWGLPKLQIGWFNGLESQSKQVEGCKSGGSTVWNLSPNRLRGDLTWGLPKLQIGWFNGLESQSKQMSHRGSGSGDRRRSSRLGFLCHASSIEVVVALSAGSECTRIPYFRLSYLVVLTTRSWSLAHLVGLSDALDHLVKRHFLNLSIRPGRAFRFFHHILDSGSPFLISGLSSNFSIRGKIAPMWYNKINEFLIPGLRYYHRFGRFCKRCPFAWMM
uniref:Uncharacterized protein n=1 Tax=Fagus sylvatica TaxID=28930 RepID=A0A2N9FH52_FAGSY